MGRLFQFIKQTMARPLAAPPAFPGSAVARRAAGCAAAGHAALVAAWRWRAAGTCLSLICLAPVAYSRAADVEDNRDESRLKLAMMYNFSNFVEWPAAVLPRPDTPFLICVMGADPFGPLLQALEKRNYQGHPIVVGHPTTIDGARKCHILYIDKPAATALGRDVGRALANTPVLTVSSGGDATDAGIAIGFILQNERIRWNMNLNAIRQAQLKVSAKLIEIAVNVIGEGGH